MEPSSVLSGLPRALASQGRLTPDEATGFEQLAAKSRSSQIDALLQNGRLSAAEVARCAADVFGLPLLDLSALNPDYLARDLLEDEFILAKRVVPLYRRGGKLFLGMADPSLAALSQEVMFKTGLAVEPVVIENDKIEALLGSTRGSQLEVFRNLQKEAVITQVSFEADEPGARGGNEVDDAPVVRFIQKIMLDAVNSGASDIHFEPYETFYRVRYRNDGVLRDAARPPIAMKDKIASRIKVVSRLDISEKRVPQDGRMKLVVSKERSIDFRVSTLPTMYGEKIVLRVLDQGAIPLELDALGYEPDQKAALLEAIAKPYGMILVTGPTGSGKTVSLYTCLSLLNTNDRNIATAEDPVEINVPGINQVEVNEKSGMTFAMALRAFLRQDPDILMVGEIRDLETADIAVKAAQTGHLVLSTLHTNDAPSTLVRLANIGVAPFNIASSVLVITAQRLARRLCPHCKRPVEIPHDAMLRSGFLEEELDGSWLPYGPVGCEQCKGTGYRGRVGIYQVMPISEDMARIIMRNGSAIEIAEQAEREGIRDLRRSGLLKVRQGVTSLVEVMAATND